MVAVHRLAVGLLTATFMLILVGGLVHATGSSLACPDWPTCYGSFTPKMEGGVLVEHSHRLVAFAVSLTTAALAFLATRRRRQLPPLVLRNVWLAAALVIVQAVLGGVTVLLRLPTTVSTLHTATSLLFFTTVAWVVFRTRRDPGGAAIAPAEPTGPAPAFLLPDRTRAWLLVTCVFVFLQSVLGGLVRHSGAALLCTVDQGGDLVSFPLCRGSLWPSSEGGAVLVHALHRLGAITTALLVIATSVIVRRSVPRGTWVRRLSLLGPILVLGQIALGVFAVETLLHVTVVEAHLGVAALLLLVHASMVLLGTPSPTASATALPTTLADLVKLGKPRITGLVLATWAGGHWLSSHDLRPALTTLALVGTALVVVGANTLNMLIERGQDALMERTRRRPLPEERLHPATALVFGTATGVAGYALLLLATNTLTANLGALAFLSYVLVYTPLKLRSGAALFVGAIPGALPPVMGYTAGGGGLDAAAAVLFGVLFLWQVPHFLAIAVNRREDYERGGFRVLSMTLPLPKLRALMLVFEAALVLVTMALVPLHLSGRITLVAALALGALFIGMTARGPHDEGALAPRTRSWARGVFVTSLVYLTLLFAALAVDRIIA